MAHPYLPPGLTAPRPQWMGAAAELTRSAVEAPEGWWRAVVQPGAALLLEDFLGADQLASLARKWFQDPVADLGWEQ